LIPSAASVRRASPSNLTKPVTSLDVCANLIDHGIPSGIRFLGGGDRTGWLG
jgi:hypothetical protein